MRYFNTDVDLARLARDVAHALGPEWVAEPDPEDDTRADLRGPTTEVIELTVQTWKRSDEGKLHIDGARPDELRDVSVHPAKWGSIRVSYARGPEEIAADIERRLLPGYHEALALGRQRKQKADDLHRRREQAVAAVLDGLDGLGTRSGDHAPYRVHIDDDPDKPGVRGTVETGSEATTFDIRVPNRYAGELARHVAALSRRITGDTEAA